MQQAHEGEARGNRLWVPSPGDKAGSRALHGRMGNLRHQGVDTGWTEPWGRPWAGNPRQAGGFMGLLRREETRLGVCSMDAALGGVNVAWRCEEHT